MHRINLDHNASAPLLPEVLAAMEPFLRGERGNPSSVHWHGRRARAALEDARAAVAGLLGGRASEVFFTSGATEANNLALAGIMAAGGAGSHIILTAVEHPSVRSVAAHLESRGHAVTVVSVDAGGRLDPGAVAAALRPTTALVSVQLTNHETGVLQPVADVARIVRGSGARLHTDAAQAVRRSTVDVEALGVDLLTLSGHKIGGPAGIGALWVRRGVEIEPQIRGGGQEAGRRSGTENLPAAVGLGRAAVSAVNAPAAYTERVAPLRDRLEAALRERWPGAMVHGGGSPRVANTASIGFPGLDGEAAVMRLDLEGIAVSLGSACDAGTVSPSEVLLAMGVPGDLARGSIRFSLGLEHSEEDVERCVEVFGLCVAAAVAAPAAGGTGNR